MAFTGAASATSPFTSPVRCAALTGVGAGSADSGFFNNAAAGGAIAATAGSFRGATSLAGARSFAGALAGASGATACAGASHPRGAGARAAWAVGSDIIGSSSAFGGACPVASSAATGPSLCSKTGVATAAFLSLPRTSSEAAAPAPIPKITPATARTCRTLFAGAEDETTDARLVDCRLDCRATGVRREGDGVARSAGLGVARGEARSRSGIVFTHSGQIRPSDVAMTRRPETSLGAMIRPHRSQ